jgi:uncharacterized membrane protein
MTDTRDERLADFLGWFSLGLGATQLVAPGRLNAVAGIRDDAASRLAQRFVGVREVVAFALIEADRPRPVGPLWGRVAGDAIDLVLLGNAWSRKRASAARLAATIANIAAVTALDVYAARRLEVAGRVDHIKAAITVHTPRDEVVRFWSEFEHDPAALRNLTADGRVRFAPAPGEQGTEIHVELDGKLDDGGPGELLARALGAGPTERVKDDLRRFKQAVETGEVVRSEGSPEGANPLRQLKQRPAQPLPEESRS